VSQENVEAVRRIFEAWSRGDFSSIDWADADIHFRGADKREARGRQQMTLWWADWLHTTRDFRAEALEYFDGGDQIVTRNRFSGTGRTSGVPFGEMPGACRFQLRDGKVVELQLYIDPQDALREAGIDPG
jgi:ketosteroid isomerase-like protein